MHGPGDTVLTGATDRALRRWRSRDLAPMPILNDPHPGPINALAVAEDETVYAALLDGPIAAIDLETGQVDAVYRGFDEAYGVTMTSAGRIVAVGDHSAVLIEDASHPYPHTANWTSVHKLVSASVPEREIIVIAGHQPTRDRPVVLIDLSATEVEAVVLQPTQQGDVLTLAASRSGLQVAVGDERGELRIILWS